MTEDIRKQIRGWQFPSEAVTQGSNGSHCVLLFIELVDEMSSLMMWCSQGRLTSKKFNWHAVAVALPKKTKKNNMYSSLNIEGLQEEEHGVLCAACHYYTHVDWCKLIGSIVPFLLVCWLKEMGYLIWKWTCCCCSYLQSLFHIISITIKRINLLKLHPLTKKRCLFSFPVCVSD